MNTSRGKVIDPNRPGTGGCVELLLALGIVPYGGGYHQLRLWVSEPPLPDSVIDAGLRQNPT